MTEKELTETIKRLEQTVEILNKLPPEVRNGAFNVLLPFISGGATAPPKPTDPKPAKDPVVSGADAETFFGNFNHDKPADNVKLITAHLYASYGLEPFSLTEVRELATEVGLTIPTRPDMTLKDSRTDGKNLYRSLGHDKYAPTVHGEGFLKTTYKVAKGKSKRTTESK